MALAIDNNCYSIKDVLTRIALAWERRAQVNRQHKLGTEFFDKDKNDFVLEQLPFFSHPHFLESAPHVQSQILSAAWLAYNRTTIDIETDIVNPVCAKIVAHEIPALDDPLNIEIASKTMIDESYHVLLTWQVSEITIQNRGLQALKLPKSGLVESMIRYEAHHPVSWQKLLIRVATCLITEIFIGAQLETIAKSEDQKLQPINKLATKIHFLDESTHGTIFNRFALNIYAGLDQKQKQFFRLIFPEIVYWFVNGYHHSWLVILEQLKFAKRKEMVFDCLKLHMKERINSFDYAPLNSLYQELNLNSFESDFRELCQTK